MITRKILICIATMLTLTLNASAADNNTKVYIFGFAESFNDSTIYLTEIQELDSAYISKKTKFLYGRSFYSAELQSHLSKTVDSPTTAVFFSNKRKNIEKKYVAMRKKYMTGGKYVVKDVLEKDFKFSCQHPDPEYKEQSAATKKERKAEEKKFRKDMKERRKMNGDRPGGPGPGQPGGHENGMPPGMQP